MELALFGSVLRDDFSETSDIDVLVTFEQSARITFATLDLLEGALATLFGRDVDLVSRRGVEQSENELRRQEILDHLETVYRAALGHLAFARHASGFAQRAAVR